MRISEVYFRGWGSIPNRKNLWATWSKLGQRVEEFGGLDTQSAGQGHDI